jgi:hypothetical protein
MKDDRDQDGAHEAADYHRAGGRRARVAGDKMCGEVTADIDLYRAAPSQPAK